MNECVRSKYVINESMCTTTREANKQTSEETTAARRTRLASLVSIIDASKG
jgi:hypothetical protein